MPPNSVIVLPSQGSVWDMEEGRPTTFKLLSEQTQGSMAVFEEIIPVGGGTPVHIHHTSDEAIFILKGEFTFKIAEQISTAEAGTWVYIPRGIAHAWKNTGRDAGQAIYIFSPAEGAKVFEELRLLNVTVHEIPREKFEEACRLYGYEMVGPPL